MTADPMSEVYLPGMVINDTCDPDQLAVEQQADAFFEGQGERGSALPRFVREEFEAYLRCGRLEHGFIRAKCTGCRHEHRVAFSCKRRGWCPSCASRRMAESGAHLVDNVLPKAPYRQWVLSFPWPLRMLFAARPQPCVST
jgi:ribosomal protein S27E